MGSFKPPNPSAQFATIQQTAMISDLIGDDEVKGCPNSVDKKATPFFRFQHSIGPLSGDGLPILGLADSQMPEGKLRILLLGDNELGIGKGENSGLDAIGSTEDVETIPSGSCLALEQKGILANTGGAKTLRFDGALQCILLLCLCHGKMFGSSYPHDALVFKTGNLDLILGMAWLQSLGKVLHDWQNAWMKFTYAGTQVMLQGISTTQLSKAALNQWLLFDEVPPSQNSTTLPSSLSTHLCLTSAQQHSLSLLLSDFASLFLAPSGLPPSRSHDHHILLNSTDTICVRPYRYPHILKAEIERQVHELLQLGMIRPSKSPYSSSVILVRKKNNTWRMCVDYRALNSATIPDKYPIPVVEELLDELHGAQFFSKLDLKSGYNQIRMSEGSIEKTALRTHDGHYEYLVMPFGRWSSFQKSARKRGSRSETISRGTPWSFTKSATKADATMMLVNEVANAEKCPYLESQSTSTIITVLPCETGRPVIKSMAMFSKTKLGIAKGCNKPLGGKHEDFICWHT
ncbi:hypothetical protein E3N88_03825 [Mikania micrantha]|uniref:Reverse transcriptase domain-containing protein n=1 Tax=Mikania micrantha TaxID=192012 RepID=A0A5N6PTY2_9ASTR|nr:hypothetical protein E3N88_03825 [Mikania micrantha]